MLITKENEPDMASIFAVSGRESEREEEEDETETQGWILAIIAAVLVAARKMGA